MKAENLYFVVAHYFKCTILYINIKLLKNELINLHGQLIYMVQS